MLDDRIITVMNIEQWFNCPGWALCLFQIEMKTPNWKNRETKVTDDFYVKKRLIVKF